MIINYIDIIFKMPLNTTRNIIRRPVRRQRYYVELRQAQPRLAERRLAEPPHAELRPAELQHDERHFVISLRKILLKEKKDIKLYLDKISICNICLVVNVLIFLMIQIFICVRRDVSKNLQVKYSICYILIVLLLLFALNIFAIKSYLCYRFFHIAKVYTTNVWIRQQPYIIKWNLDQKFDQMFYQIFDQTYIDQMYKLNIISGVSLFIIMISSLIFITNSFIFYIDDGQLLIISLTTLMTILIFDFNQINRLSNKIIVK